MSHSKLANIHPNAKIGKGVIIEPFATIKDNTVIEDGCWIGPNAVIWEGARLGKNVKVYNGASVSSVPQDLKFAGEETEAVIGANTTIRECVTISRGTVEKYKTTVGENCLLMAYAHVAHDCVVGDNCILANAVQLGGHVELGDWAVIGGCSSAHQFVKIGAHVMISAGCVVRKDVPPYVKAGRDPITYAGINKIGLKRRGFNTEKISSIEDVYQCVFFRGLNYSDAMMLIQEKVPPSFERDYILDFIRDSKRGIMKGFLKTSFFQEKDKTDIAQ